MSRCCPYPQPGVNPRSLSPSHTKKLKHDERKRRKDEKKKKKKKRRREHEGEEAAVKDKERRHKSREDDKTSNRNGGYVSADGFNNSGPHVLHPSHSSPVRVYSALPEGRDSRLGALVGPLKHKQSPTPFSPLRGSQAEDDEGEMLDSFAAVSPASREALACLTEPGGRETLANEVHEREEEDEDEFWVKEGTGGTGQASGSREARSELVWEKPRYLPEFDVYIMPYIVPH